MSEILEQLSRINNILGSIQGMIAVALGLGVVMYIVYLTNRR